MNPRMITKDFVADSDIRFFKKSILKPYEYGMIAFQKENSEPIFNEPHVKD